MSLIVTHISRFGVLQIADSALTTGPPPADAGDGKKVFPIPYLKSALAVAGTYAVGSVRLDRWVDNFISSNPSAPDLKWFATAIAGALTHEADRQHHIFHIGGYGRNAAPHLPPEFWYIGNFAGIDETTGNYTGQSPTYSASEDFLRRDLPGVGGWKMFCDLNADQVYVNGLVHGRKAFNYAFMVLHALEQNLLEDPSSGLRAAISLDENERRMLKRFELVTNIYERNHYPARFIGGDIQVLRVAQP